MQTFFSYAITMGHVNLVDVLWSLRLEMGLVLLSMMLGVWGLGLEMKERRQVRKLSETAEVRG